MECDNEKCRSPHESISDLDKKIIFLQNYIRKVQDKCIVITNNDLLIKHNLEIAAATINLNFVIDIIESNSMDYDIPQETVNRFTDTSISHINQRWCKHLDGLT